jgi:hypothetical protein
MLNELTYVASVVDGQVKINNRKSFDKDMQSFEGQRIFLKVSRYAKDKSKEQRGYYRAVVVPEIYEGLVDIGYRRFQLSLDIVHELLKEKFLTVEIVNEDTGEFLKVTRRTEDLTMPEYAEYITNCIDWAHEFLNISITLPRKQGVLNFKNA